MHRLKITMGLARALYRAPAWGSHVRMDGETLPALIPNSLLSYSLFADAPCASPAQGCSGAGAGPSGAPSGEQAARSGPGSRGSR